MLRPEIDQAAAWEEVYQTWRRLWNRHHVGNERVSVCGQKYLPDRPSKKQAKKRCSRCEQHDPAWCKSCDRRGLQSVVLANGHCAACLWDQVTELRGEVEQLKHDLASYEKMVWPGPEERTVRHIKDQSNAGVALCGFASSQESHYTSPWIASCVDCLRAAFNNLRAEMEKFSCEEKHPNYPVDSNGICHGPIGNNPRHPLDMD